MTASSRRASTIVSVEEFFYDDPNTPWKPLPEHDLKSSPCYPIIDIRTYHNYKIPFYYCKLHPDIENVYLETIEHHCKYKDPNSHKSEIKAIITKLREGGSRSCTRERCPCHPSGGSQTEQEAEAQMIDVQQKENEVRDALGPDTELTQNEFDALV